MPIFTTAPYHTKITGRSLIYKTNTSGIVDRNKLSKPLHLFLFYLPTHLTTLELSFIKKTEHKGGFYKKTETNYSQNIPKFKIYLAIIISSKNTKIGTPLKSLNFQKKS